MWQSRLEANIIPGVDFAEMPSKVLYNFDVMRTLSRGLPIMLLWLFQWAFFSTGFCLVPVRNSIAEKLRQEDVQGARSPSKCAHTPLEATQTLPRSVGTPDEGASTPTSRREHFFSRDSHIITKYALLIQAKALSLTA